MEEDRFRRIRYSYLELKSQVAAAMHRDEALNLFLELFDEYDSEEHGISAVLFLIMKQEWDEALTILERIIQRRNDTYSYYLALYLYPTCLKQAGENVLLSNAGFRKAIEIYEKAYKDNEDLFYLLGFAAECYSELGDVDNTERCKSIIEGRKEALERADINIENRFSKSDS